jgi:flagellum-specific peptidoglycan hydrolase FlgJ
MAKEIDIFRKKYMLAAIDAARGTKIFPKTIITAAALESNYGKSQLSKVDNNFFGIKGKGRKYKTKEQVGNKLVTITDSFKVYNTPKDSFKDYVRLLNTNRYKKAGVLTAKNELEQFRAIKKGGYATDANYINKLNSIYKAIPVNENKTNLVYGLLVAFLLINTINND